MKFSDPIKGVFLATFAGCCWGTMGVFAQYLFTYCQFTSGDLTALRLIGAGILLLMVCAFINKQNVFSVFKNTKNLRDLLVYGGGLLLIQYCFFVAIEVSNAGTAAIMVGFGPLFIILYEILAKHRRPEQREIICLILALLGITLIVTKGDFSGLNFSAEGAVWGLMSAAFGAFCTVQPKAVIDRIGVSLVVGWGMVIGGAIACFFTSPFSMNIIWSAKAILCYAFIVAFGTVAAFWCYLKSTEYIRPSITAILASFEPFSAVVLSVLLLGAFFNGYEIIGGVAILANMVILSWKK